MDTKKKKPAVNKQIKIARIQKDISQGDLADITGLSRQTIGMIENGRYNPSLKVCIRIAKALDKTLDDLFWVE